MTIKVSRIYLKYPELLREQQGGIHCPQATTVERETGNIRISACCAALRQLWQVKLGCRTVGTAALLAGLIAIAQRISSG
jgi:hypothetical protein